MSKEASVTEVAEIIAANPAKPLQADEVAAYLRNNPDFFLSRNELLAELSLPHESGNAVSLLERQVRILRERGIKTVQKLDNLLENARNNDQLFNTIRGLVLALLRAGDVTEIVTVAIEQLASHDNIDACEMIVVEHPGWPVAQSVRTESLANLQRLYSDVFRLRRTHCGKPDSRQLNHLFPTAGCIRSTALCPVISHDEVLALLALGNRTRDYFNVNLDTLFLDFIGHVIGALLDYRC